MKKLLPNLLGGVLASASIWISQSFGLSFWPTSLAVGLAAFSGTYAGQKMLGVA